MINFQDCVPEDYRIFMAGVSFALFVSVAIITGLKNKLTNARIQAEILQKRNDVLLSRASKAESTIKAHSLDKGKANETSSID